MSGANVARDYVDAMNSGDWDGLQRLFTPDATVVALRAVPDQIRAWQASDTPADVGRRVIATIVGRLHVDGAALAVFDDGGHRTVAAQGVDNKSVDSWLTHVADPIDRVAYDDPMFVYRFPLLDAGEPIGLLLLTGRAGGARLARDEIAGIQALVTPLGAALKLAHRRERRDRHHEQRDKRYEEVIASLRQRLAALEGDTAGNNGAGPLVAPSA